MLLTLASLALSSGIVQAQTFYGSIVGTVTDSSGATVPGAAVTAVNSGTGERRTSQSNAEGKYEFVNLVPGRYRVDVEKTGFKHLTRDEIEVQVQATVRVDAGMQIGDVGQTVEVTAEAPLLQTETASLGTVVEQRKLSEMPLNGRNPINLVALVPGVVAQGDAMNNPTGQNINAFGNFQINGGIAAENAFCFTDGAPLNFTGNVIALVPTQDALQEFKVQTNAMGPEFGRFAGGVINFTSKSGSNEIHGQAYEFLRNKVLNANTFFNNRSGLATPSFTQNQFGTNIGGPIRKDKTFLFFSWEGFRVRQGDSVTYAVPTLAQRAGDFSNTRTASGALIPIYDPTTNTCAQTAASRALQPGQFVRHSRVTSSRPVASIQRLRSWQITGAHLTRRASNTLT